jgi:hypothetical protein
MTPEWVAAQIALLNHWVMASKADRRVVGAFVVLAVAPFTYAAAHSSFWQRDNSMAPLATVLFLVLLLALVRGRYRWAWLLFALLSVAALAGWPFDAHRFEIRALVFLAINLGAFALLLSPPMRRRLKRPVGLRRIASARLQS